MSPVINQDPKRVSTRADCESVIGLGRSSPSPAGTSPASLAPPLQSASQVTFSSQHQSSRGYGHSILFLPGLTAGHDCSRSAAATPKSTCEGREGGSRLASLSKELLLEVLGSDELAIDCVSLKSRPFGSGASDPGDVVRHPDSHQPPDPSSSLLCPLQPITMWLLEIAGNRRASGHPRLGFARPCATLLSSP